LSTLSHPLTVDGQTNGALNAYSRRANGFGAADLRTGQLIAAQAAVVLANATAYWTARSRAEQLEQALVSRAVIEQAKGIIISTMRCSADEAFQVLVKQSQQQNRKLREVADEVVTNASRRP
jgi:AmiR/NasT family two-component response regulator